MEQTSQTQTPPTQMPPMSQQSDSPRHTGRIVGMILALLVLFGAGGVGAYMYYMQVPDHIIEQSFLAMQEVDTVRLNAQANIHFEPDTKK